MGLGKPPPKRMLKSGFSYLRHGMRSISTGSKANLAISEAKRLGASGRELLFTLMTVKHRVLLTGRQRRKGLSFLQLEELAEMDESAGIKASTKTVLGTIDAEREMARKQAKTGKVERRKKPSIELKGMRGKLAASIKGLMEFGWDPNIKTRFQVFKNLMNETQKQECEQVCQWLEAMGEHYMHRARNAGSYSQHTNQADFSMRCYGAAGFLYGKHGFKDKEFELQKLGYALNARLGLA